MDSYIKCCKNEFKVTLDTKDTIITVLPLFELFYSISLKFEFLKVVSDFSRV